MTSFNILAVGYIGSMLSLTTCLTVTILFLRTRSMVSRILKQLHLPLHIGFNPTKSIVRADRNIVVTVNGFRKILRVLNEEKRKKNDPSYYVHCRRSSVLSRPIVVARV